MCFVRLLLISFFENKINDLLSVKSGIGLKSRWKSLPNLSSQVPSAEAKEPAMSSASIVDRVTMCCFFEFQEMGALLCVNNQLDVDF